MRSVDRLEQQRRMTQKKNKAPSREWETEEEMERPEPMFLNRSKSIFDRSSIGGDDGINTAASVFDRKAVFRTDESNY